MVRKKQEYIRIAYAAEHYHGSVVLFGYVPEKILLRGTEMLDNPWYWKVAGDGRNVQGADTRSAVWRTDRKR